MRSPSLFRYQPITEYGHAKRALFFDKRSDTMAISSIGGSISSVTTRLPSASCPTCGNASAAKSSTAQAFSGGYKGRTDSFACANCGTKTATTPTKTATSYCPTCSNNAARSSAFPSTAGNSAFCPTCNKGQTSSAVANKTTTGLSYNTATWAR